MDVHSHRTPAVTLGLEPRLVPDMKPTSSGPPGRITRRNLARTTRISSSGTWISELCRDLPGPTPRVRDPPSTTGTYPLSEHVQDLTLDRRLIK